MPSLTRPRAAVAVCLFTVMARGQATPSGAPIPQAAPPATAAPTAGGSATPAPQAAADPSNPLTKDTKPTGAAPAPVAAAPTPGAAPAPATPAPAAPAPAPAAPAPAPAAPAPAPAAPAPEPPAKGVILHLHVMVGSRQAAADGILPGELQDMASSLKNEEGLGSLALAASFQVQVMDGAASLSGMEQSQPIPGGAPDGNQATVKFEWKIDKLKVDNTPGGVTNIYMQGFQLATSVDAGVIAQLKTDLYLSDGRKALVGTAGTVGDKVLLVVALAKAVR